MPPTRCPVISAAKAWPSSCVTVASNPKYRQVTRGRERTTASRTTRASSVPVTWGTGDWVKPAAIRSHQVPAASVMPCLLG